jgi:diguanylate cyclase (GGDEF)-like protein/PAS domain S-box-containing protein
MIGHRLGLFHRVALTALLGASLSAIVAIGLAVVTIASDVRREMSSQFQSEMEGLSVAIAASVEVGHFGQVNDILNAYLKRPGVRRVNFRDVSDTLDLNNERVTPQNAPDWFVERCGVAEMQASLPIMANGQYFGVLTLALDSMPAINRAWDRLLVQFKILLFAVGLGLFGTWAVLRHGLRPLRVLVEGSRALGAGKLSQRIPVIGGPDFRTAIEAFNHMASDLEQVLADLRLREENLRVTLQSIGDAVLTTDTRGNVVMMNRLAEVLTGWTTAEAYGRPVAEVFRIINEQTRETVTSPVDLVLAEGKIVGLANHTLLIARDGSEHPIADSGAPIRAREDGPISGVVLVFRDQGEQHRMLKALNASEQLYATIAKAISAGVFRLDNNGNYLFHNQTFLNFAGMTESEPETRPLQHILERIDHIHPDDRAHVLRGWHALQQGDYNELNFDYRYRHNDGRTLWAKTSVSAVIDPQGRRDGFVGVIADITAEHEQLEKIVRLSRLYDTFSQINSAVAQAQNEGELFPAICRIAVERGGFSNAMIALLEDTPLQLRSLYSIGDAQSASAAGIRIANEEMADDSASHRVREALLQGESIIENNMLTAPGWSDAWRLWAQRFGIQSALSIPLRRFGEVIGILTLYSRTADFLTVDVATLVDEIGRDLSRALENLERNRQRERLEHDLAINEERLRLSLASSRMGSFEHNLATGQVRLDAVMAQLLDIGNTACEMSFTDYLHLLGERGSDIDRIHQENDDLRELKLTRFTNERSMRTASGALRWIRVQGGLTGERDSQGRPTRIVGVISDVTSEHEQDERERLTLSMFQSSLEAIMIADADFKWIMVNPAFTAMTGFEPQEVLGREHEFLSIERNDPAYVDSIKPALLRDLHWRGEVWSKKKDGTLFPALLSISAVTNREGKISHIVGQATDISMQKAFEERISYLAYRDSLTDLPNRALLRDRVEQGLATAQREQGSVALLFIDLDHFKNINDSLGHHVGDSLLREVAKRLLAAVREMDTVGRLGGDEFLIMLPGADAEAAAHVAQKLLAEVVRPFNVLEHTLSVTPSIGIALYPRDGGSYDDLLKTADTAMYRAKGEGRNAYRFFTPEMNQAVFQRMVLENSLRRAVEVGEFVLFYQPQFPVNGTVPIGAEALIRWPQPEMGFVSPGQFIPVAEECGLIEPIGNWVIGEACRQIKAWQADGLPALRVSINVSARQFASRNLVRVIDDALARHGVAGHQLEIEITESLLANDMEYVLDVLRQLKARGIWIAVDDFGTGYSSLSYLKRFPIDRLKIDQSFVRDLEDDEDDRAIAAAVVTLGHTLGMHVIAEGVETRVQLELLRDMGCDEVQGYHLGRPVPASELTGRLRAASTP